MCCCRFEYGVMSESRAVAFCLDRPGYSERSTQLEARVGEIINCAPRMFGADVRKRSRATEDLVVHTVDVD